MQINPTSLAPSQKPRASASVDAQAAAAAPVDAAVIGRRDDVHLLPGLPYASVRICPQEASTPEGRSQITDRLIADMKAYPSVSAVYGMLPDAQGNTQVVVASRDGAVEGSEIGGAWRLMRDLSSSPTIKAEAAKTPSTYTPAQAFDPSGRALSIRLPGQVSEETVVQGLHEGGAPNQTEMLKQLVENLPKGVRVAVLMAGPSAAGKSTLAAQIKQFAGDRHVAEFPGDMYFRDADDPALPKTPSGSVYWDDPQAMHFDEMAGAIATLCKDGHADIPVYDFSAVRPGGWHDPNCTGKGMRLDQVTPTDIGKDDILVIDSLHAANAAVIDKLKALDLPHATVYLDAQRAEDRLVRRMVRDFDTRGRSPQQTLSDWDMSTFPGEVKFVRPTMLELDPAQDLALVNKFPNDMGLTRAELDHKVAQLDKYGLAPTYPALKTADDGLAAFAVGEEKRLRDMAANPQTSDADRARAQAAADRIAAARQTQVP